MFCVISNKIVDFTLPTVYIPSKLYSSEAIFKNNYFPGIP
ncbi:hypothetical protein Ahos_1526 [Acidianus hospitalis W1]|uniref:Uncharacterized protein n=1 Tax=Acidianus hospitalis (strain W1) TaxID=933801 RepID=F4B5I5_ACIHW|nr:hypothetical protein Ahos_1526 [Acidianus hospitalis W1]